MTYNEHHGIIERTEKKADAERIAYDLRRRGRHDERHFCELRLHPALQVLYDVLQFCLQPEQLKADRFERVAAEISSERLLEPQLILRHHRFHGGELLQTPL